jgi:hypothetical protein
MAQFDESDKKTLAPQQVIDPLKITLTNTKHSFLGSSDFVSLGGSFPNVKKEDASADIIHARITDTDELSISRLV